MERIESSAKRTGVENKLSSRISVTRPRAGSRLSYTTINEDLSEMNEQDKNRLDTTGTLDQIEPTSLIIPKRTKTHTILERTNWREKVENSLLEASQFLNEETWETKDSQVESLLRRYGVLTYDFIYYNIC